MATTTEVAARALELALIHDAQRKAAQAARQAALRRAAPAPVPKVWGNRAQRRAAMARALEPKS